MNNKNIISSFTGKYFFLSNYFEANVIYKGLSYSSSEAAYQAQKCAIPGIRLQFALIIDPDQAKQLSKQILVVDNWHEIKLGIMKEVVKAKFDQNPKLKSLLLKTGNKILIEGNTWGDKYWGQVDGIGENHLGIILMELRDEYALKKKSVKTRRINKMQMKGYKVYFDFNEKKFVAQDYATNIKATTPESTFLYCGTAEAAKKNAEKLNTESLNEIKQCKQCGKFFWQTKEASDWYTERNLVPPKKCAVCRKRNKMEKAENNKTK